LRSSRDHPALHSFPTRRSSDLPTRMITRSLAVTVVLLALAAPSALAGDGGYDTSHSGTANLIETSTDAALPGLAKGVAVTREHLDRKSTRLNSSHRTISYAVFC